MCDISLQIRVALVHRSLMSIKAICFACSLLVALSIAAKAQKAGEIPNFLGPGNVAASSATEQQQSIHFVTTLDFPPFNFLDTDGRLTGFNVYLARQVCAELALAANCIIQGMPWDELEPALAKGQGNAIIAGVAATELSREKYVFSKPYLRVPARFVALRTSGAKFAFNSGLADTKIGIVAHSAFDVAARSLFPKAGITGYASDQLLIADLKSGDVDLIFGDGVRLAFLLSTEAGDACCDFVGDPYFLPHFLGEGMRVAFPLENESLKRQVDLALKSLQRKGKIDELYMRFFPKGFY